MERDWDLVRTILLAVEAGTDTGQSLNINSFPDINIGALRSHVELLFQGGLIEGHLCASGQERVSSFFIYGLTWDGHEFLDEIRAETVWEKTKGKLAEARVGLSAAIVRSVASSLSKAAVDAVA
ncbi:MAG: DUF2513 domain-containing protein [Thermoplasmatota archaeon]